MAEEERGPSLPPLEETAAHAPAQLHPLHPEPDDEEPRRWVRTRQPGEPDTWPLAAAALVVIVTAAVLLAVHTGPGARTTGLAAAAMLSVLAAAYAAITTR